MDKFTERAGLWVTIAIMAFVAIVWPVCFLVFYVGYFLGKRYEARKHVMPIAENGE